MFSLGIFRNEKECFGMKRMLCAANSDLHSFSTPLVMLLCDTALPSAIC